MRGNRGPGVTQEPVVCVDTFLKCFPLCKCIAAFLQCCWILISSKKAAASTIKLKLLTCESCNLSVAS